MNLYQKISSVMSDIEYLSKDDNIQFGNTKYRAISEEKVTVAVRKAMVKYGLVMLPIKQEHKREGNLSIVDVIYKLINIENPEEFIEIASTGTGADTQDKGVGKAMTYAYKYALLRSFMIPTGEDTDKISSEELEVIEQKAQKAKADKTKAEKAKALKRTDKELEALVTVAGEKGYTVTDVQKAVMKVYKKLIVDLTPEEYSTVFNGYQKATKRGA